MAKNRYPIWRRLVDRRQSQIKRTLRAYATPDSALRTRLAGLFGLLVLRGFRFGVGGNGGDVDKLFLRFVHVLFFAPWLVYVFVFFLDVHGVLSLPRERCACYSFAEIFESRKILMSANFLAIDSLQFGIYQARK
ncbi:MAG TPA: hypothetical protein VIT23_15445 [Terrimicrobiaceae bacterium]